MRTLIRSPLSSPFSTRIMTGLQPTGDLTVGNYLGSIDNLMKLQAAFPTSKVFLGIMDLHSLTNAFAVEHSRVSYEGKIGEHTREIAKAMVCSGVKIDGDNVLFIQSQVKEHAELCWILGCIGPQHWLNIMIQYKEKSHENSSLGIYSYPTLMAADILLYRASYVPVGEDQRQHLELARRYAERFNKIAKKELFPLPEYVVSKTPRVMSLTDPSKKMSKSDANERSRINLSDSKDQIASKIRRAVTDSQGSHITYDPQTRKGLANLLKLYEAFSNVPLDEVVAQFASRGIGEFKSALIEIIAARLGEIQSNMRGLSDEELSAMLREGCEKARAEAAGTMKEVKALLQMYN